MIILEGVDGSGKTTLLKDLTYIYENLENVTPKFNKDTKGLIDRCNQILQVKNKASICDRSPFLSELVYGNLVRNGDRFSAYPDIHELGFKMMLHHQKQLVILCDPEYRSTKEFLEHHKVKDYDDEEEVKKIAELYPKITALYRKLIKEFKIPVINYNYRDPANREHVIKKIGEYINER